MNVKKVAFVSAFCTFFSLMTGCAVVDKTYGPDGRQAFTLNCSGPMMTWADCQKKAGELCGSRGYDTLDRSSNQTGSAGGGNGMFAASSSQQRSMMIACK